MKSIVFFLFFVLAFFIPHIFSYTSQKARLYDLLKKPSNAKIDSLVLAIRNDNDASTTAFNQQSASAEDEKKIQTRNNWDSGEDYYFLWANQNRRPVEYLTGRKRETEKMITSVRARRINGGLWRSGLVG